MMGTVTPIKAARYEREAVRLILHEASEAAQKRLGEFETDDHITGYIIGLLQMECWRIEYWASGKACWEDALANLRYVAGAFEMTEHNLRVLLICLYIVDDRYRDAI
jgi:hypothetical protein